MPQAQLYQMICDGYGCTDEDLTDSLNGAEDVFLSNSAFAPVRFFSRSFIHSFYKMVCSLRTR